MRAVPHRRPADRADELYAAPLADFVRTRNTIAAKLRGAGKVEEAKALRAIAKPKATVWGINRVAREEPKTVRRVVAAFDRLKRAQLRCPHDMGPAADFLRTVSWPAPPAGRQAPRGQRCRCSVSW